MTTATATATALLLTVAVVSAFLAIADGLGSGSTLAVVSGTSAVCGILAGEASQSVSCVLGGVVSPLAPNISFESIAGGRSSLCGLVSGGVFLVCWNSNFRWRRIYDGPAPLTSLSVGDDQVCAVENATGILRCWRGGDAFRQVDPLVLKSVTSGRLFSCGILANNSSIACWGSGHIAAQMQADFANFSMSTLVAGDSHVCGVQVSGSLICKGNNNSGQLNSPSGRAFEFTSLALEANRSCATRRNGTVVCWGGGGGTNNPANDTQLETIVSGFDSTCGLSRLNLSSILCWGSNFSGSIVVISAGKIIPGPCTQASCGSCEVYPDSENLCSGSGRICKCESGSAPAPPPPLEPSPPPLPPPTSSRSSKRLSRGLLAFAIIGSVGALSGIGTIIYCMWTGICCGQKKIHNSVQPTITPAAAALPRSNSFSPMSRSATIRRQSSRAMRRQRSGTSSKHTDRAEEFTLAEMAIAANNFSPENKIGAGSFGTVYRGKLADGREVAIKRGETGTMMKKFQEKEYAFQSELAFLSRLHHKHLVGLVGFCEENDERLLVYEYMKNGALYDQLHYKTNSESEQTSLLNSWKMRIKIVLDAARGIEYLHSYAVPPIIHRDIKSSNILLDANWTARVSDFGLSLMGPESDGEHLSMKAAGTVGYMDPEYYGLHHLTPKSDVYGLGVVLLEVLTGRRAIFKEEGEAGPTSVVDYAVPRIVAGELTAVLDPTVKLPELNESEAVELVAYTAMHCVNLEGKERPTMGDVVANLERALSLCEDSHGSISSASISLASD
ncbi:putative serine/threonine-protein kinase-like protein CCR3 [Aristolochia californica]|uniref:putative serine/threonine-protein kinase-like protein CCR3 n=1 Tax=Aristolochia californica TaxID=171875 RepID=UPI0035DCCE58